MTRKDFEAIAAIIAEVSATGGAGPEWLAERFAEVAKATNPRFDRDRFFRACGVGHLAAN